MSSLSKVRDDLNTLRIQAYILVIDSIKKRMAEHAKKNEGHIEEIELQSMRLKYETLTDMREYIKHSWDTIMQLKKDNLNHTLYEMQLKKEIRELKDKVNILEK